MLIYLLRDIFHMLPNQLVARRVEEDRKTPRISKGDQMRLSREVLYVEHSELRYLLARDLTSVYPVS